MVTDMQTDVEANVETQEEAETPKVDINHAGVDELATLPGIGPNLAERIVAYRDARGPFLLKQHLTEVPGIDAALYEDVRDEITVTVPSAKELVEQEALESAPDSAEAERTPAEDEEVEEADVVEESFESAEEEEAPPIVGAPAVAPAPPPAASFAEAEETITPEAEEEREPAPAQPARGGLSWLWVTLIAAMLGGLLGLFFSMLVFAGINGAVDVSRTQAMDDLRGQLSEANVQLDALQGTVSDLQGDVRGVRERVEVLSGLTARMEQAETAVQGLNEETAALQEETGALQDSVEGLGQDVNDLDEALSVVEEETERATTFFERLRETLNDLFGEPEPDTEGALPLSTEVAS
jgi:competence ComEA-like helix-hairpin-helix protein